VSKLSDEITNDPLGRGYAGMDAEQVAFSLTEVKDRPVDNDESIDNIKMYLLRKRKYIVIKDSPELAAREFMVLLTEFEQLLFDNPGKRKMFKDILSELVDAGLLTSPMRTALLGFVSFTGTRSQELGLGRVRAGDVKESRNT